MNQIKQKFYKYGLLLIVLVMLALYFQYSFLNNLIMDQKKQAIIESKNQLNYIVRDKLKYYSQYIAIAEELVKSDYTEEQLKLIFNNINDGESKIRTIYFVDNENNIIYSKEWNLPKDYDPSSRAWYIETMRNNRLTISNIYPNIVEDKEIITISKPVYANDGSFLGLVAEDIGAEEIIDVIKNSKLTSLGKTFLIDGNYNIFGSSDLEDDLDENLIEDELTSAFFKEVELGKLTEVRVNGLDGYLVYDRVGNPNWIIASFIGLKEFKGSNNDIVNLLIIWIVLSILLIGIFAYIIRKHLLRPLTRFYKDLEYINSEENTGYRFPVYEGDVFKDIRLAANEIIDKEELFIFRHQKDTEEIKIKNDELEAYNSRLKDMESKLRENYKELIKSQTELRSLSYKDRLTGLYNRRYFEEELEKINREENLPISIIMADINGLKLINDSFGHEVGDELIWTVADTLKKSIRDKDIVSRISGDEFLLALPQTDEKGAQKIVDRIKEISKTTKLKSTIHIDMELAASFGIATKKELGKNIKSVIKKAEEKMYDYKLNEGSDMKLKTIESMISELHEKNPEIKIKAEKTSQYAVLLARALKLPDENIKEIKDVSRLLEIGMIPISDKLYGKKEELTEDQRNILNRHPEIGYRMLSTVDEYSNIAKYVLYHHERYDGTGYPKGLRGEEIPLISRIINITTSYVVMKRYGKDTIPLSQEEVLQELIDRSGTSFDPELLKIFVEDVLKLKWDKDIKN